MTVEELLDKNECKMFLLAHGNGDNILKFWNDLAILCNSSR